MDVRPEVKFFAEIMEEQLQKNEHKGGWKDCGYYFLEKELRKNLNKLEDITGTTYSNLIEIQKAYKDNILRRAANVANFAMMIADVCGALGGNDQCQD